MEPVTVRMMVKIAVGALDIEDIAGVQDCQGYSYNSEKLLQLFEILGGDDLEIRDTGIVLHVRSPFGQAVLAQIKDEE